MYKSNLFLWPTSFSTSSSTSTFHYPSSLHYLLSSSSLTSFLPSLSRSLQDSANSYATTQLDPGATDDLHDTGPPLCWVNPAMSPLAILCLTALLWLYLSGLAFTAHPGPLPATTTSFCGVTDHTFQSRLSCFDLLSCYSYGP